MKWVLVASVITAATLGTFFILAWRRCVDRFCPSRFWNTLYQLSSELLRGEDPAELLHTYRRLFANVASYTAGNIIGLALGLLPVALLLYLVAPVVDAYRDRALYILEVYPGNTATLSHNNTALDRRPGTTHALYEIDNVPEVTLTINTTRIILDNLRKKTGICWSYWYCALFESFGFRVIVSETALTDEASYIVVRPDRRKYSLLWPILNDIESVFLVTFLVTNIVVYVADRRHSA